MRCPGRQTLAPVAGVPWEVGVIRATMDLTPTLAAMTVELMLADMGRCSRGAVAIQAMAR